MLPSGGLGPVKVRTETRLSPARWSIAEGQFAEGQFSPGTTSRCPGAPTCQERPAPPRPLRRGRRPGRAVGHADAPRGVVDGDPMLGRHPRSAPLLGIDAARREGAAGRQRPQVGRRAWDGRSRRPRSVVTVESSSVWAGRGGITARGHADWKTPPFTRLCCVDRRRWHRRPTGPAGSDRPRDRYRPSCWWDRRSAAARRPRSSVRCR